MTDLQVACAALARARAVLLVDWPSAAVPNSLLRRGYEGIRQGGSGTRRLPLARPPSGRTALSRCRPADRRPNRLLLPAAGRTHGVVGLAVLVHADVLWFQSGVSTDGGRAADGYWLADQDRQVAARIARDAQLALVSDVYIVDVLEGMDNRLGNPSDTNPP